MRLPTITITLATLALGGCVSYPPASERAQAHADAIRRASAQYHAGHPERMAQYDKDAYERNKRIIETWKLACAKHQPDQPFPCELAGDSVERAEHAILVYEGKAAPKEPEVTTDYSNPTRTRTTYVDTPTGGYRVDSRPGMTTIRKRY